jgi:hypothetical protein
MHHAHQGVGVIFLPRQRKSWAQRRNNWQSLHFGVNNDDVCGFGLQTYAIWIRSAQLSSRSVYAHSILRG